MSCLWVRLWLYYLPIFQLEIAEAPDGEEFTAVWLILQLQRLVDVVQGSLGQASLQKIFGLTDEDKLLSYHGETSIKAWLSINGEL